MTDDALDLRVPRNTTALLQLLQRLVGIEQYRYYCAGVCPLRKLSGFVRKMEARYPIARSARGRAYDRQRGRAAVQLIVFPPIDKRVSESRNSGVLSLGDGSRSNARIVEALHKRMDSAQVQWWLVSTEGEGGLADPRSPDEHVARDATLSDQHVVYGDYVLVYAHKKSPREITDRRGGRTKKVLKDESTWTWKMRGDVVRDVRAMIDECCSDLDFGWEPTGQSGGRGLRGLLYAQRSRPLFSGVRTQVLELERYARDEWRPRAALWRAMNSRAVEQLARSEGEFRPIHELLSTCMPKMIRQAIYESPPLLIRDLLSPECASAP